MFIRKRITYANVVATLALVFSMAGGAMAAKHYLINSTKQINPKVIKALKGKTGPQGLQGKEGPTGKEGPPGKEGLVGKEGKEGKEGTPATKLFAVVSSTGTLVRGSGAVSVTKEGTSAFIVKFDQDITKCAFLATVGTTGFEGIEPGDVDVAGAFKTTDSVFVETHSNSGTAEAKSFHLAVLC